MSLKEPSRIPNLNRTLVLNGPKVRKASTPKGRHAPKNPKAKGMVEPDGIEPTT